MSTSTRNSNAFRGRPTFVLAIWGALVALTMSLQVAALDRSSLKADAMVEAVQQQLVERGYDPGKPDGILGKRTKSALKQFQRDWNLPATGTIDSQTTKALGLDPGSTASEPKHSNDDAQKGAKASHYVAEKIEASIALKLLLLGRSEFAAAEGLPPSSFPSDIQKAMDAILSKYKYEINPNLEAASTRSESLLAELSVAFHAAPGEFVDVPVPFAISTNRSPDDTYVSVELPDSDKYFYLLKWPRRKGESDAPLPDAACKSGTVSYHIEKQSAAFSEETKCMLDGKEYIFYNTGWYGLGSD